MNFCCIFTNLKNFELYKSPGQLPYYLAKEQGYKSTLVSFDNDTFTNFKELDEIDLVVLKKKFSINFLNNIFVINWLVKNAKSIDVLNCYHYTIQTFMFFLVYKIFNRKGIVYLRIDAGYPAALRINGFKKGLRYQIETKLSILLFKYFIDFASIETKKAHEIFIKSHEIYKKKLMYLPVFINPNPALNRGGGAKRNQVISVGRIGAYQKASDIVVESFKNAVQKLNNDDWILKLVGPISDDFEDYLNNFLSENPYLKDRIIVTGNIEDRDELYKIYSESKILLLPSRHGSFEIVFCEALFYDDYLIITDVGTGSYLVDISGFGEIIDIDNLDSTTDALVDAIENFDKWYENKDKDLEKLIIDEFGYKTHTKNLRLNLDKIKQNKTK